MEVSVYTSVGLYFRCIQTPSFSIFTTIVHIRQIEHLLMHLTDA